MGRKLNRTELKGTFLTTSAVVCLAMILVNIVSIVIMMMRGQGSFNIFDIISLGIDVVFYCFIASQFYKARTSNNYGFALYAVLSLALVEYVIPAIMFFIQGIFVLDIITTILAIVMGLGVGLAYGIILIIEARNHKKGLITALKVLGIILGVVGLLSLISGFTYMGMELTEYFLMGGVLTTLDTLAYVMEGVAMIVSFLFTLIFSIFPFYLDDERKYN